LKWEGGFALRGAAFFVLSPLEKLFLKKIKIIAS
jgi:hypothetical protein